MAARSAAWRHLGARTGFEVVFVHELDDGHRFAGRCTAVEAGRSWSVAYTITVDAAWVTREAELTELSGRGEHRTVLEHDGAGHWLADGVSAAALDRCLDADLEASAFTNALPVRRLALEVGETGRSPAAWVRSPGLAVERLDQTYVRLREDDGLRRYSYAAPRLGFSAELRYDEAGLGTDYPGLAVRVL